MTTPTTIGGSAPVQVCPICDIAGCRHIRASASPMDVRKAARVLATDPVRLAKMFHAAYEEMAEAYGYTTRPDTRTFDEESPNGCLMVAAVTAALRTIAETGGRE